MLCTKGHALGHIRGGSTLPWLELAHAPQYIGVTLLAHVKIDINFRQPKNNFCFGAKACFPDHISKANRHACSAPFLAS